MCPRALVLSLFYFESRYNKGPALFSSFTFFKGELNYFVATTCYIESVVYVQVLSDGETCIVGLIMYNELMNIEMSNDHWVHRITTEGKKLGLQMGVYLEVEAFVECADLRGQDFDPRHVNTVFGEYILLWKLMNVLTLSCK